MPTLHRTDAASCVARIANCAVAFGACLLSWLIPARVGALSPPPGLDPPPTVFTRQLPPNAWALAVDPEGNAYVVCGYTVWRVSAEGEDLGHWVVDLEDAIVVAIEATTGGELFIRVEPFFEQQRVLHYTADGVLVDSWPIRLNRSGRIGDMAIDDALNVYIASTYDYDDTTIDVFDQFGNRLRTLPVPYWGDPVGGFPYLDVDASGQLWVAHQNRMHRFSADGEVLEAIEPTSGWKPGKFRLGPEGNFYVAGSWIAWQAPTTIFTPRGDCLAILPDVDSSDNVAIGPQGEIFTLHERWPRQPDQLVKYEALPSGILLASDPPGRPVLIDGVAHEMPWFHAAPAGTQLQISVSPTETPLGGTRYDFTGWSDGSLQPTRDSTVPLYAGSLHASFDVTFVGGRTEFSISASDVAPWENTAPASGLRNLYLWLTACEAGISALEADVLAEGALQVFGFNPVSGVYNVASAGNLMLAIPNCPTGESLAVLLGWWVVMDDGGGLCLQASAAHGVLGSVDCRVAPQLWDIHVRGFSSDDPPCRIGPAAPTVHRSAPAELPTRLVPGLARPTAVLHHPHPNPFRDRSTLDFSLATPRHTTISVYDVSGRLIRRVLDGSLLAGSHSVIWDGRDGMGRDAASGAYFVRLETGEVSRTRKIVLLERK